MYRYGLYYFLMAYFVSLFRSHRLLLLTNRTRTLAAEKEKKNKYYMVHLRGLAFPHIKVIRFKNVYQRYLKPTAEISKILIFKKVEI